MREFRKVRDSLVTTPEERPSALDIFGETFQVIQNGAEVRLSHPRWSLEGVGRTLPEARLALAQEASEVAPLYLGEDDSKLTADAIKFKGFLSNF